MKLKCEKGLSMLEYVLLATTIVGIYLAVNTNLATGFGNFFQALTRFLTNRSTDIENAQ